MSDTDEREPQSEPEPLDGALPPGAPQPPLPDLGDSVALLGRYQAGDESALQDLLDRYQARIRRIVRVRLGSRLRERLESMDVVQEVNLVALRKLKDFEPRDHGSLLHWLSRIALNQIRDVHKHHGAERRDVGRAVPLDAARPDASSPGGFEPAADSALLPEERAWQRELQEITDDSMTRIPPQHQEVILLRDYCGMSWPDVARELGAPSVGAAQESHRRAKIKLRRVMAPRLRGLM